MGHGKWGRERIGVFTKPGWTAEVRRNRAPGEEPEGLSFLHSVVSSEITCNSINNPSHLCTHHFSSLYFTWNSHNGLGKETRITFLPTLLAPREGR